MMRSTTRPLSLLAIGCVVMMLGRAVDAGTIQYSSSGDVGSEINPPVGGFSFQSTSGTLLTPGSLTLGSFDAVALMSGSLTYTNLPFYINVTFTSQPMPEWPPAGLTYPELSIQGVLNGTTTGSSFSDVVATVSSVQAVGAGSLPFPISSFNLGPQMLAPSSVNGGQTALVADIQPAAVPEPTPMAMAALLAGWGAYRLFLRRRRPALSTASA